MLRADNKISAGVLKRKGRREGVLGLDMRVLVGLAPEFEVGDCKFGVVVRLLVELVRGGHYHKNMIVRWAIKDMCPIASARRKIRLTLK